MRMTLFALACIAAAACSAPAAANELNQAQPTLVSAAADAEPTRVDWMDEPCPRRTLMRGHRRTLAAPRHCRTPAGLVRGCAYELNIQAAARRNAMGKRARRNGIARCVATTLDVA
jgi:hypothetical protein